MDLGRLPDAVEIGAKTMESRETMALLLRDPAVARRMRKSFELVVLEPTQAEDAVFLEGWAVDAAGAPLEPADDLGRRALARGGEREPHAAPRRAKELTARLGARHRLPPFRLRRGLPRSARRRRGVCSAKRGGDRRAKAMHKPASSSAISYAVCRRGRGWRGHVDRGGWQRAAKIALARRARRGGDDRDRDQHGRRSGDPVGRTARSTGARRSVATACAFRATAMPSASSPSSPLAVCGRMWW